MGRERGWGDKRGRREVRWREGYGEGERGWGGIREGGERDQEEEVRGAREIKGGWR